MNSDKYQEISDVADQLLDVGTLLMASGAHIGRIVRNLSRLTDTWGYALELDTWYTGMLISIRSKTDPMIEVTRFKRCNTHGVQFDVISQISLLTWKISDENLDLTYFETALQEIKQKTTHQRIEILLGVGVACAGLCMVSGGDWRNGILAFIAAFIGLLVRQELTKRNFNVFITVVLGAFVTSLIAGIDVLYHIGASPEKTLATSVLYLVPGVPLINAVIDLIEGYIPSSIARGIYAAFLLVAIAIGITFGLILLGLENFYSLK